MFSHLHLFCHRIEDLSTQYYLSEESIGKPRAEESFEKLKSLNPLVQVSTWEKCYVGLMATNV